ncbi:unnamed protein product [Leuciscus chuanchicus]
MTGLRLSDSGWYLCSVGDLQVPVQLTVNEPKPVTHIPTTTPSDPETDKYTTQTSANRNPTIMITDLRPETRINEAHPYLTTASVTINTEIHRQDEQNNYLLRHFCMINTTMSLHHYRHDVILLMNLVATLVLFLLVFLIVIVTWRLRKKPERGHIREEEHFNTTSNTTASENQMTSISPAAATALSSVDPEADVIYSSVKKPRKAVSSYPYTPCSFLMTDIPEWILDQMEDKRDSTTQSLSPSSGSVWDLHPCNGLMMWVEMISGGRCFRLMTSLKNPQIVAFLEEKEGVKIFAPDVSVMNSSVSGHEGDNVSVQCFYTSGYKNKLKQWCRYKDQSCYTEKRTDTSQNSSVQISDDGRSSFTVLMTGLRLSDSGWYFCSVGDLQVPVQLTVQKDNNTYKNTCNKITRNESEDASSDHRNRILLLIWTAVPLLTLVLVIWRIKQKHSQF